MLQIGLKLLEHLLQGVQPHRRLLAAVVDAAAVAISRRGAASAAALRLRGRGAAIVVGLLGVLRLVFVLVVDIVLDLLGLFVDDVLGDEGLEDLVLLLLDRVVVVLDGMVGGVWILVLFIASDLLVHQAHPGRWKAFQVTGLLVARDMEVSLEVCGCTDLGDRSPIPALLFEPLGEAHLPVAFFLSPFE